MTPQVSVGANMAVVERVHQPQVTSHVRSSVDDLDSIEFDDRDTATSFASVGWDPEPKRLAPEPTTDEDSVLEWESD
jgi:hypothetical protein